MATRNTLSEINKNRLRELQNIYNSLVAKNGVQLEILSDDEKKSLGEISTGESTLKQAKQMLTDFGMSHLILDLDPTTTSSFGKRINNLKIRRSKKQRKKNGNSKVKKKKSQKRRSKKRPRRRSKKKIR